MKRNKNGNSTYNYYFDFDKRLETKMNIDDLMNVLPCKLARKRMIQKNKVEKIRLGKLSVYEFDPLEVILEAYEVVLMANRKQIKL